jgi:hypothetical protein
MPGRGREGSVALADGLGGESSGNGQPANGHPANGQQRSGPAIPDDGIKENHGLAWRLLEQVRQSLCNQPAEIPLPELHAEVLHEQDRRLTDGETVRAPWSKAKAHLQRLAE